MTFWHRMFVNPSLQTGIAVFPEPHDFRLKTEISKPEVAFFMLTIKSHPMAVMKFHREYDSTRKHTVVREKFCKYDGQSER